MTHLWDGLCAAYRIVGFEVAAKGDNVFRDLVLARIIEPTSKIDAERVLNEVGVPAASYATLKRRLPSYAKPSWRQALAGASARHARLGPASLVLYDVSTLYFETDAGDGFREPGFSKERRLEPQITLGLLTDAAGFPLTVEAFEGNKAETATMLPVINAFKAAHRLTDVTVVADAGMISEANQIALQAAGLSYVLGTRIPFLPDVVREWCAKHPDEAVPDLLMLTQPWSATSSEKARGIPDRVIYYQYRHDRARRTLRGIDEQIAKAPRAVDGKAPVKRNRFIKLAGATKTVNRELEAKNRALAGWKGYTTNLTGQTPEFVIDAYHQLWRIEKSFRMSEHDLQARPIYHHVRESIDAHLSIVVAAMAVSHWIEAQTGWSIKKFVRTARRYRTVRIKAGEQTLTAADPLPDDLREALIKIRAGGVH
ncbi:IS1634 family transposase [Mycolicibacterium sarraceniae]|uniref:IS1634 family transposase n=2 Tax=Mycolicibacterium sarraceniae TaxID=1534348 RepID=A0A7I7SKL5_9MYCO|nr:IS1634 family transposase [Mycolicibacterium sarraceniae]